MDNVWTYTAIALGAYIALFVADKCLQKYKEKKRAVTNVDGTASNGTVDAGTND